ncbi:MAG: ABC transporter permease [Clostridiales bacterium]|jgi:peptide/nickel transport system permease protein|nr:ABC transporter permease [Clostridiales bacterium]
MFKYIIKRLLWMIPVVLGVLSIVFILSEITSGDPVDAIVGYDAPIEVREAKREELGLNDPVAVRFISYIVKVVTRGDLGESYATGRPVLDELLARFPNTLILTFASVIVALIIAIPLGLLSAVKQYSVIDNASMAFALFGVSIPQFWFALLTLLLFSVKLRWLPASGIDRLAGWVLPVAMVGIANVGNIARTARSSMLEVVRQDYIRTARAKGQKEIIVVVVHGLRNALIPVIANVGNTIGVSLGGAIIAESIFSISGVGQYMLLAINQRNWPSIQGGIVLLALAFSVTMLVMDLLYTAIDPRLRAEFKAKNKIRAKKNSDGEAA